MAIAEKSDGAPSVLEGQPCPMCNKKTLTLMEAEKEVPLGPAEVTEPPLAGS